MTDEQLNPDSPEPSSMKQAGAVSAPQLKGHVPALDGVRGLAIAMVLAFHFIGDIRPDGAVGKLLYTITSYGALGVDLFFVLSGFLITGILFDSRKKPAYFRNFYMRRVLRIFPLYYMVLLIGLIIVPLFAELPELDVAVSRQGWLWAYSANLFVALMGKWESLPAFSHFWSLAVEEHFYLVWPLVVFLCDGPRLKRAACVVIGGALLFRIALVLAHVNDVAVTSLTPGRLDALAMGGLMAVITREADGIRRLAKSAPWMLGLGLGLAMLVLVLGRIVPAWHPLLHQLRMSGYAVGFCGVLIFALTGPGIVQRFFRSRTMTFFGKYSYGLYVFHFLYGYYFIRFATADTLTAWIGSRTIAILLQAAAGTLAAILISLVSYHVFEKQFLKLKARF